MTYAARYAWTHAISALIAALIGFLPWIMRMPPAFSTGSSLAFKLAMWFTAVWTVPVEGAEAPPRGLWNFPAALAVYGGAATLLWLMTLVQYQTSEFLRFGPVGTLRSLLLAPVIGPLWAILAIPLAIPCACLAEEIARRRRAVAPETTRTWRFIKEE